MNGGWNNNDIPLLLKLERIYADAIRDGTADTLMKRMLDVTRGHLSRLVPNHPCDPDLCAFQARETR